MNIVHIKACLKMLRMLFQTRSDAISDRAVFNKGDRS